MKSFFKLFPELAEKETYLTGESYAGIYIPYLARRIFEHNDAGNEFINLKGVAIGNGVTNWKFDCDNALWDMAYAHGLISTDLNQQYQDSDCDFSRFGGSKDSFCLGLQSKLRKLMKNVFPYDLLRPTEESYDHIMKDELVSDEPHIGQYSVSNTFGSMDSVRKP